eukprot:Hpha_TRINITY_DN9897_c0_g2::TRINITY_DN9897_c0_g2_i2::g.81506::m.81506
MFGSASVEGSSEGDDEVEDLVSVRDRVNQIYTGNVALWYMCGLAAILTVWTIFTWNLKDLWVVVGDFLLSVLLGTETLLRVIAAGEHCCTFWYVVDIVASLLCIGLSGAAMVISHHSAGDQHIADIVLMLRYAVQTLRICVLLWHYRRGTQEHVSDIALGESLMRRGDSFRRFPTEAEDRPLLKKQSYYVFNHDYGHSGLVDPSFVSFSAARASPSSPPAADMPVAW